MTEPEKRVVRLLSQGEPEESDDELLPEERALLLTPKRRELFESVGLRARVRKLLWAGEFIPDSEVHIAMGVGASTYRAMKARGVAPPRVKKHGCHGVYVQNLKKWFESIETLQPSPARRGLAETHDSEELLHEKPPPTAAPPRSRPMHPAARAAARSRHKA